MRKKAIWYSLVTCFLALSVSAFAQMHRNTNEDEFFGPGPGPGTRNAMQDDRWDRPFMGGYGMMAGYINPEMENIAESYKIKIEKIFLEAKESRVGLNSKRRELYVKLRDLADKYPDDKSVSRDIVSTIKELNNIQKRIQDINERAMDKIAALNRDREKELRSANDNWIKKIETDEKELTKYLDFIGSRPQRPMLNGFKNRDRQAPPKD